MTPTKSAHQTKRPTSEALVTELKERGIRMTKIRRTLIELLSHSATPLSAADLLSQLSTRELSANKTTVYRELDFLLAEGLISEIDILDGMKRYEVVIAGHHHHHLVCTSCKSIQCAEMENDLTEIERMIRSKYHFKVTSHILEFFGVCTKCSG
jgi:Fur family ferric uptake transcriptional regulator